MKVELDEIERAHLSSLISSRKETIEKILNAVKDDKFMSDYYEKESKLIDEINKKLFRKEKA